MDSRDVEVACPCCDSRLQVDVRTGKVLRWRRKGETDETGKPVLRESDWDSASQRVQGRLGDAGDKFDRSLSREKGRSEELDDLFRKANEKLRPKKDED